MLKVAIVKQRGEFTLRAQFEAPTPGIIALFGRSGCGKTSTIDMVAGLLRPDEGRIELDGEVVEDTSAMVWIAPERRRIGYVFQDVRLFPHLTVLDNLEYGRKRAAPPHAIGLEQTVALLGLGQLLRRRPHALSGGERQRVALGRALLSQPRMLLLDEPLASIDAARRDEVLPYFEALRDQLSLPMIYVSHQFDEVLRLATFVVLMEAGRVVAQGTVAQVSLTRELREIIGADAVGAVLDGLVASVDSSRALVELRVGSGSLHVSMRDVAPGARVRVQLLARDIILATEAPRALSVRNALTGTVVDLYDDQEAVLVRVDVGGGTLLSRVTRSAVESLQLRPGLPVWALVKAVSTRGHAFRLVEH